MGRRSTHRSGAHLLHFTRGQDMPAARRTRGCGTDDGERNAQAQAGVLRRHHYHSTVASAVEQVLKVHRDLGAPTRKLTRQ